MHLHQIEGNIPKLRSNTRHMGSGGKERRGKILGYNIELWSEGKTIRSANLSVSSRKNSQKRNMKFVCILKIFTAMEDG